MFANCIRRVLSRNQYLTVSRTIFSGRFTDGRRLTTVLSQSNQGRPSLKVVSPRTIHSSEIVFDKEGAARNSYELSDLDQEEISFHTTDGAQEWKEVSDVADKTTGDFKNFRLCSKTVKMLQDQGINYLFPVQSNTFNPIYDEYDVIVQARTGSGKTMSYAIPLVEKLLTEKNTSRYPKMLVLTPTRELANQVAEVVKSLSSELKVAPVYGGASITSQENLLRRGADIVVGTPGRILDLISRDSLNLRHLSHVVLDEVDRMLDMGFTDDVDNILKHRYNPSNRESNPQTLLFSATVPHWVRNTAKKYLSRDLQMIDLIGEHSIKTAINVKHTAMLCSDGERENVIVDALQRHSDNEDAARVIVFCQTKREVDRLGSSRLLKDKVGILHGDISQSMREVTLKRFKEGSLSCLVATDVAARGLDVPDVDVVIQCSPPQEVDSYIHRSGRTGRAGKSGEAILLYSPDELHTVNKIENVAGFKFERGDFKKNPEDVKKNVIKTLRGVNERTKQMFSGMASELLEQMDQLQLVSSALAVLCGHEQKSLITFQPGYVTFMMTSNRSFEQPAQAKFFVSKRLNESLARKVRNLRLCADHKSAVFDVPTYNEDHVKTEWVNDGLSTLSIPEKLPAIDSSVDEEGRAQQFGSFSKGSFYRDSSERRPYRNSFERRPHSFDRESKYARGPSFVSHRRRSLDDEE